MRFKFDQFVIDGDRRMVWRGDHEVHVAPKTLDFLLSLLGRAPNAVSKAELMTALWPDTHVSDATLGWRLPLRSRRDRPWPRGRRRGPAPLAERVSPARGPYHRRHCGPAGVPLSPSIDAVTVGAWPITAD